MPRLRMPGGSRVLHAPIVGQTDRSQSSLPALQTHIYDGRERNLKRIVPLVELFSISEDFSIAIPRPSPYLSNIEIQAVLTTDASAAG